MMRCSSWQKDGGKKMKATGINDWVGASDQVEMIFAVLFLPVSSL